ncbi:MAG: ABC transporter ATP-binding protein [Spirochaetaceae bacterium]|jgi:ABC-type nitrate/sulfonate/bicarbonate transport system ATPase subunit|nr:ABC transporter ATP-binding protein [Spirochaetaceae bacterium]
MSLISLQNIERIYRDTTGKPVYALKDVNLAIEKGEFVSLVGPSGCGKTTLLRLIAGLDRPQAGAVFLDGSVIAGASSERGYIFQQATLFPWATVYENVALGLKARKVYKQNKHRVQEYLSMIGLDGFEQAYPHEISGGMAQRVAIIRSLINEPKVLLLDEPLGALDAFKRTEMQELLRNVWQKTGTTMLMVTHDVDEAIAVSQRVIIMSPRPGRIVSIMNVELGSIRERTSDAFIAIRKRILEALQLILAQPQPEYSI